MDEGEDSDSDNDDLIVEGEKDISSSSSMCTWTTGETKTTEDKGGLRTAKDMGFKSGWALRENLEVRVSMEISEGAMVNLLNTKPWATMKSVIVYVWMQGHADSLAMLLSSRLGPRQSLPHFLSYSLTLVPCLKTCFCAQSRLRE